MLVLVCFNLESDFTGCDTTAQRRQPTTSAAGGYATSAVVAAGAALACQFLLRIFAAAIVLTLPSYSASAPGGHGAGG